MDARSGRRQRLHIALDRLVEQRVPRRDDGAQEQILTPDYESCWGYVPGECWHRDNSIRVAGAFAKSIPDMKFDIKGVLVSSDRVIVRGGGASGELP
jgi:hypothetical protein